MRWSVLVLVLGSCSASQQNRICIGQTTTPTERCTLFEDVSDGLACSASAYALEKMDEQLAKDANAGATARSAQSFVPIQDAGVGDGGLDGGPRAQGDGGLTLGHLAAAAMQ